MDSQNLGITCQIWAMDLHLETPKHTVQGVHIFKYDDTEDDSFPAHILKSEENCQVCGRKGHTKTTCDKFFNNIIVREIYKKHTELERQLM